MDNEIIRDGDITFEIRGPNVLYRGTKDALVRGNFASHDWFPISPKRLAWAGSGTYGTGWWDKGDDHRLVIDWEIRRERGGSFLLILTTASVRASSSGGWYLDAKIANAAVCHHRSMVRARNDGGFARFMRGVLSPSCKR